MRHLIIVVCLLSLALVAVADESKSISRTGQPQFEAQFPAGGRLRLNIRSSDLKVSGWDEDKIKVEYHGKAAAEIADVKVTLKTSGDTGELSVSGGPHNDFTIQVYLPKKTGLYLRVPAGDVEVSGVEGDKDIELHAGDLNINVGDPQQYGKVDGSVSAGDLKAGAFGVSQDGLFRTFRHDGGGAYRLHAHVGAGDLNLMP